MLTHAQLINKALIEPHQSYKSSNFYYEADWHAQAQKDDDPTRGFKFLGSFGSYTTTVANLMRNKITGNRELHITMQRYSPTTDRQLSRLRWQAGQMQMPIAVYDVPWISTRDEGRMSADFLNFAIAAVNDSINELLGSRRNYKTYVFVVKQFIECLKEAMRRMTDTVPEEIYAEYFTTEQKDKLQEAINLRVLLGSLLHHSNEDGRILKQALLGLRELNK
jgi:hypothetical protein